MEFMESLLFKVEFSPSGNGGQNEKVETICSFAYSLLSDDRYPLREMGIFAVSLMKFKKYTYFYDPDENLYLRIEFKHATTEDEIEQALQEERDWNGFSDPTMMLEDEHGAPLDSEELEMGWVDIWVEKKENTMRNKIRSGPNVPHTLKDEYICCLFDFESDQAAFRYIGHTPNVVLRPIKVHCGEGEECRITYK